MQKVLNIFMPIQIDVYIWSVLNIIAVIKWNSFKKKKEKTERREKHITKEMKTNSRFSYHNDYKVVAK